MKICKECGNAIYPHKEMVSEEKYYEDVLIQEGKEPVITPRTETITREKITGYECRKCQLIWKLKYHKEFIPDLLNQIKLLKEKVSDLEKKLA